MSKPSQFSDRARGRRALLRLGALLLLSLATLATPFSTEAQSQARLLDPPRAAGQVGERYDGFAVAHGAVPPNIAALIDQVNAERRAVYAERARSEGAPVEAIGKIYAGEIIKSAPAGTWFLAENGQWTRK
jgi:uncharacterized protein YdbL (DUF1318 family)